MHFSDNKSNKIQKKKNIDDDTRQSTQKHVQKKLSYLIVYKGLILYNGMRKKYKIHNK